MTKLPRQESIVGTLDDLSVEQVQELIRAGDNAAAEAALWQRLEPALRVCAACAAYRKAPAGMDRADLVNQALGAVRMKLVPYSIRAERLEGYLKSAVRSRVADLVRRHLTTAGKEYGGEEIDDILATTPSSESSPEEVLLQAEEEAEKLELARMLHEGMNIVATAGKYGPRRVTAVRLKFYEQLKVAEIAERLGISKRAAEYALSDGINALRDVLRGQFGVGEPGTLTPEDGEDDE